MLPGRSVSLSQDPESKTIYIPMRDGSLRQIAGEELEYMGDSIYTMDGLDYFITTEEACGVGYVFYSTHGANLPTLGMTSTPMVTPDRKLYYTCGETSEDDAGNAGLSVYRAHDR